LHNDVNMSTALPLWHILTASPPGTRLCWTPEGRQVCPRLFYTLVTGSYLFIQPVQLAAFCLW